MKIQSLLTRSTALWASATVAACAVACSAATTDDGTFDPSTVQVRNPVVDTNGDGVADGVYYDKDGDNVVDFIVVDLNADGVGDGTVPYNPSSGGAGTGGNAPGAGGSGPGASGGGPINAGGNMPGASGGGASAGAPGGVAGLGAGGGGAGNGAAGAPMGTAGMEGVAGGGNGMAGSGAGGGGAVPGGSTGCGKDVDDQERAYTEHPLTVPVAPAYQAQYTNRRYFTWLPANYDPTRPYPLVFYGAGCGATGSEPQPAQQVYNDEAILVFLLQVESCFNAGSGGQANTPDVPYFDMALNEIKDNYCVDEERVFMSGYSSGAWFSITLSCSHGDVLRGIAVAAGGQQPQLPACNGSTAALFFVSSNDGGNPTGGATGSSVARDRLLAANGCTQETTGWDARWPSCQLYSGCTEDPVVWCDHMGGHSNGQPEGMATDGWWKFFTELP